MAADYFFRKPYCKVPWNIYADIRAVPAIFADTVYEPLQILYLLIADFSQEQFYQTFEKPSHLAADL